MKLNPNFLSHETRGTHYLISSGESKFKGIVRNNETAALIVDCLKNETTENAVADKLLSIYSHVDRRTVECDVANIIGKLRSIGALEE